MMAPDQQSDSVTFLSYNSTGMNTMKARWLCEALEDLEIDYCAIQEHFKNTKSTDQFFRDKFSEFNSYVIPAHRAPGVDSGRASGGITQLSRKCYNIKKDRVKTQGYRVQAQVLNFPGTSLLWINAYLPTDPGLMTGWDETNLLECLSEIEKVIRDTNHSDVLLSADLNWDPVRRTQFANTVKDFVGRTGLVSLWQEHPVDYTHVHTDYKSTSTLDHFLVSPRLVQLVSDCGVRHSGDNMSRHSPIYVRLKLGSLPVKSKVKSSAPRRPAWARASEQHTGDYTDLLQERLRRLTVPDSLHCDNPLCDSQSHSEDCDSLLLDVLCSVVEAGYTTIPLSGGGKGGQGRTARGGLPGWGEEVRPYQVDSNYWHRVWVGEGRPSTGPVHDSMVRSRTQYHYAVRRCSRQSDETRARKLFEASLQGDTDLLKEMKRVRSGGGGGQDELPENVEGCNTEDEIVNRFRTVYSTLYNCADTKPGMEELKAKIKGMITPESVAEANKVTSDTVKKVVKSLKSRKSDISGGFTSDALLNAPDEMFDHLATVFRSWLVHGKISHNILSCAFLPLLKSALKDPADTNSYRAIAGSSLILKIFEKTILELWGGLLSSDSLQFGYKAASSTTQASWLVHEVLGHYMREGAHPICALLDCSKAFDLAKWDKMFTLILERQVPPIVARAMIYSYQEQYAWCRWGAARSEMFPIVNGTRQGSMASPFLWAVYCDPLLARLRAVGVGCHMAGMWMGGQLYCDDLVLLAPCRRAMVIMLNEAELWAQEFNVTFSTDPDPKKSKSKLIFMCGSDKRLAKPAAISLCGRALPWVASATHLGHEIHESGNMTFDGQVKRAQYIGKSVEVRESFGFASPPEVLTALNIYCTSYYGCLAGWDLGSAAASAFFSAQTVGVKLAWGVPRATHTYFVQQCLAPGATSARAEVLARFTGFYNGLRNSPSPEVRTVALLAGRDLRTTTGSNIRLVEEASGLSVWSSTTAQVRSAVRQRELVPVPPADLWRLPYLRRLLEQRLQHHYRGEKEEETRIQSLIDSLCDN